MQARLRNGLIAPAAIAAALGVLMAVAMSPVQAAEKVPAGRTLTIGITQFPSTFNPYIDPMLAKSYILAMTRRPVLTYDAKWQLQCFLCEQVPSIENGLAKIVTLPNGKKGIEVTYTLKPGLTWGDGTPLTSKDIVFAWKVGRHPKTGVQNRQDFLQMTKIDVKDDRTFTVTIDRLRFDFAQMAPSPLPAHLEAEAFKDPAKYQFRTLYNTETTKPGLYNGPYRISRKASGSFVVLVPNERWAGKKPYFRRIVVSVIGNTTALEANLLSGDIDYIAGELGLTFDQGISFRNRYGGQFRFIFKSGLIYEHIDLNLANPILQDRRVRRALLYGVNRALISKALFRGQQPVADTSVSPLDWIASKEIPKYPYDPKKARALLDDAGWTRKQGRDYRTNAKGERLSFTLMTTAGNASRERIEHVLQAHWRRIGIHIRIKNQPARVFFGTTVRRREYPAMAMYAWISAPESVPRATLHSKMVPTKANNYGGANYTGFKNAEMDQILEDIERELDPKKRKALWRRLQQIYASELPVLPLYFRANPYIIPKWLKGIVPTGHLVPTTMWIEHWYAKGRYGKDGAAR
jgi:peptide/nickel transport system substrate-binding protein